MEFSSPVLNGEILLKVLGKYLQMYKFCFSKEIYLSILDDLVE